MKQILKYIAIPFLAALSVACQERYVTYSDAEYVMFADTLATYPVQQDVEYFSIPVVSTVTRDYDRTFGVEITIPNSKERLRPGMYARATFNMGTRAGVMVDDVAVQKQAGSAERFVYVIKDGVAEFRFVRDGRRVGDKVNIIDGLEAGEQVATTSFIRLTNGKKVEIIAE